MTVVTTSLAFFGNLMAIIYQAPSYNFRIKVNTFWEEVKKHFSAYDQRPKMQFRSHIHSSRMNAYYFFYPLAIFISSYTHKKSLEDYSCLKDVVRQKLYFLTPFKFKKCVFSSPEKLY